MRLPLPHVLRLLATLVVAGLSAVVWLMPGVAHAAASSSATGVEASFAPPPQAPVPIGPSTPTMRAPLCDPRGAIMFAPPPQMQDVEATLDTGLTLDDCFGDAAKNADARRAAPGRAPLPIDASSASTDAAVLAAAVALAASARELLPAPAASTMCLRPGFRSTVDRPPRA
jgi:hypothetical protein